MRCRVRRVFEHDLEGVLDALDAGGRELLRILDMPPATVSARDCGRCSETLCKIHASAFEKETWPIPPRDVELKDIFAELPRHVLVYRECTE